MDLMTVARIMNACIVDLYEDGEIEAGNSDTVEFYGFSPNQLERLHCHKIGVGDEIWFRLKKRRAVQQRPRPLRHGGELTRCCTLGRCAWRQGEFLTPDIIDCVNERVACFF